MKRLIILGLTGLMIVPLLINANMRNSSVLLAAPYLGLHGGISFPSGMMGSGKLNTGSDMGAQIGYCMGNVRVEGALSYYSNSLKGNHSAKLCMTTLMANAYYDFNLDLPFDLFVGAGIGWVHTWKTNVAILFNGPESNEFTYQGISGVNFPLSSRFIVDIDYRRLGWTDGNGNENLIESNLNYLL